MGSQQWADVPLQQGKPRVRAGRLRDLGSGTEQWRARARYATC